MLHVRDTGAGLLRHVKNCVDIRSCVGVDAIREDRLSLNRRWGSIPEFNESISVENEEIVEVVLLGRSSEILNKVTCLHA